MLNDQKCSDDRITYSTYCVYDNCILVLYYRHLQLYSINGRKNIPVSLNIRLYIDVVKGPYTNIFFYFHDIGDINQTTRV